MTVLACPYLIYPTTEVKWIYKTWLPQDLIYPSKEDIWSVEHPDIANFENKGNMNLQT